MLLAPQLRSGLARRVARLHPARSSAIRRNRVGQPSWPTADRSSTRMGRQSEALGWDARQLFAVTARGHRLQLVGALCSSMAARSSHDRHDALAQDHTRYAQSLRRMDHPYDFIVPVWDARP